MSTNRECACKCTPCSSQSHCGVEPDCYEPSEGTTPQAERPATFTVYSSNDDPVIAQAIRKVIAEYGGTLRMLGNRAVAPVETPESLSRKLSAGDDDAIRHEEVGSSPTASQGQTLMSATSSNVQTRLTAEQWAETMVFHRYYDDEDSDKMCIISHTGTGGYHAFDVDLDAKQIEGVRRLITSALEAFRDKSEAPLLERIEQLMDAVSELNSFDAPKELVDERMANAGLREEIERLNKAFDLKQLIAEQYATQVAELRAKLAEQERAIKELRSEK